MNILFRRSLIGGSLLLASFLSTGAYALDEEAARALARESNCFKCHSISKKSDGPAWKEVAAKYKGKADAEAKLIRHITSGGKGQVRGWSHGRTHHRQIEGPGADQEPGGIHPVALNWPTFGDVTAQSGLLAPLMSWISLLRSGG